MLTKQLLSLALAGAAAANPFSEVIASQDSLSTLKGILSTYPDISKQIDSLTNVTILAPNNDAIAKALQQNGIGSVGAINQGVFASLLSYHALIGTFHAAQLTSLTAPVFVPTLLNNATYTGVTGGQVVEVKGSSSGVTIVSGLLQTSTVVKTDIDFQGGTIHIIDAVLTLPPPPATALTNLTQASLTTLAQALSPAIGQTLTEAKDVTIFAPTNDAFAAIANVVKGLTPDQLNGVLTYHVVPSKVWYSTLITANAGSPTKITTLNGKQITVSVNNGNVFVNSAKVTLPDVLIANGVLHVIDSVLIPDNATVTPHPGPAVPAGAPAVSVTGRRAAALIAGGAALLAHL